MDQEYHVVSLVVHANPQRRSAVEQQIDALAGAERISATEDAKYVVVIEGERRQQVLEAIEAVQQFNGVISTALAFHQVDTQPSEKQL